MGGGGRGVEWGREEGGCHVSMWKIFSNQCKKGWVGVANGPKVFFTVGSVIFFLKFFGNSQYKNPQSTGIRHLQLLRTKF